MGRPARPLCEGGQWTCDFVWHWWHRWHYLWPTIDPVEVQATQAGWYGPKKGELLL